MHFKRTHIRKQIWSIVAHYVMDQKLSSMFSSLQTLVELLIHNDRFLIESRNQLLGFRLEELADTPGDTVAVFHYRKL